MRTRAMSDEELVTRVRDGEKALYGALVDRYHRRLYCVALRILKNDAEAEDALQDAYVQGLKCLDQFAGRSSFFTWIARITMNEAFSRIRGRRRAECLHSAVSAPGNVHMVFASVPNPEQQAMRTEMDRVLLTSIGTLPECYRQVFTIREIEELSTAETATTLGLSEECVKTRLHRARELLKRKLSSRVQSCAARAA